MRDGAACDLFDCVDDLADGEAVASAEVVGVAARTIEKRLERGDMGFGEIGNVDVVADAGAVGRVVILTEDSQRLADPG